MNAHRELAIEKFVFVEQFPQAERVGKIQQAGLVEVADEALKLQIESGRLQLKDWLNRARCPCAIGVEVFVAA